MKGWGRGGMLTFLVLLPLRVAMLHVKKCGSFEHLKLMANRKRTMLLTDGAKCYPKVARETKTLHEWIAQNCGEFEKTVYRGMEKISCHAETDAAWSAVKDFIPPTRCVQRAKIFSSM